MAKHCSRCGSPIPRSMYNIDGVTCNACRTIDAINKQNKPQSYGSGSDDTAGWIAFGLFVFLNIIFNFFPLKVLWWLAKCVYCVAIGMWTHTCIV